MLKMKKEKKLKQTSSQKTVNLDGLQKQGSGTELLMFQKRKKKNKKLTILMKT
jgi:hypothetical protein